MRARSGREMRGVSTDYTVQVAFTEISEVTFRHLHTLSVEWHLKKKMGQASDLGCIADRCRRAPRRDLGAISARSPQVLRVMDRGIASADSVIKYLVLMMLPAFAEMFVTFVIFYRRGSYQ